MNSFAHVGMQVGEIRRVFVRLGDGHRDGRAAAGLHEVLRAALFKAAHQVQRFRQVYDGGIRAFRSESAGEALPCGNFGADQEVRIVDLFADPLIQIKCETPAVFPRAAVFPLTVVVRTQYLRTEISVAQLEVDTVRARIVAMPAAAITN